MFDDEVIDQFSAVIDYLRFDSFLLCLHEGYSDCLRDFDVLVREGSRDFLLCSLSEHVRALSDLLETLVEGRRKVGEAIT